MAPPLVTLSLSDLPGVIREALRAALLQASTAAGNTVVFATTATTSPPLAVVLDSQDAKDILVQAANHIAGELYARGAVALSVTEPIVHLCPGKDACSVCQGATDDEIRALREEARAVADWDTSRACCAALGLPTGDAALGLVDAVTARARVTARIRGQHYPVHELEYRAPRRGLPLDPTNLGGERANAAREQTPLAIEAESDGDPAPSSINAGAAKALNEGERRYRCAVLGQHERAFGEPWCKHCGTRMLDHRSAP